MLFSFRLRSYSPPPPPCTHPLPYQTMPVSRAREGLQARREAPTVVTMNRASPAAAMLPVCVGRPVAFPISPSVGPSLRELFPPISCVASLPAPPSFSSYVFLVCLCIYIKVQFLNASYTCVAIYYIGALVFS